MHEELEYNSIQEKNKAEKALKIAKEIETAQLSKGYRYVYYSDKNTAVLIKPRS